MNRRHFFRVGDFEHGIDVHVQVPDEVVDDPLPPVRGGVMQGGAGPAVELLARSQPPLAGLLEPLPGRNSNRDRENYWTKIVS